MNTTWTGWVETVNSIGATMTGATTSANAVWTVWTTATGGAIIHAGTGTAITNTGTTVGGAIWTQWVETVDQFGHRAVQYPNHARGIQQATQAAVQRTVTPEERALREAREREWQAKLEAEREYRRIAEAKAEILLHRLLNPEQKETLKEKRCFYMYSNGKKYRIDRGQSGNVKLLDAKDQIVESYCIHPKGGIPDADAMAAQKLLLETDPEMFARVANVTRRDGSFRQGTPMRAVG